MVTCYRFANATDYTDQLGYKYRAPQEQLGFGIHVEMQSRQFTHSRLRQGSVGGVVRSEELDMQQPEECFLHLDLAAEFLESHIE